VKLLFDANLSFRLIASLADAYPHSSHVELIHLRGASDETVWKHARTYGFALVSKDDDFRHLSLVHGTPPKVVWLRLGNASTVDLIEFLRVRQSVLQAFEESVTDSLLVLARG
jgi:predicted nuclease of predicted toxin-antitoxin system